ncbi:hypothetical protein [Klebsiella quasipneumoniae]|uniref:hypothetical protein n=1 Tax=Klebsiella quasipneumoniae TaxID=1463165 RepID=UPI003890D8BE
MPLRITPSVAEQEGQQTETEATGAPQKHHYTLNQQVGSITVDAIGECIQNKVINKDDVNIMIFEKNKESGTSAFTASFDDEGYFTNWPVGFFSGN